MTQSRRTSESAKKPAATTSRTFRTFLLMEQFAAGEIGARIALSRKERGLTQEELSEMGSFSKRSLQDYESGVTIPYKHLTELGRLLNRATEWFLYGDQQPAVVDPEDVSARLERIERVLEALVARSDPDAQADQG